MLKKQHKAVTLLLCLAVCGSLEAETVEGFVKRNFAARSYTNSEGALPYRLFIPTNYSATTRYPLVLFLHGMGARGRDNVIQLTESAGSLVFASQNHQKKHPSFMVAPQCPTNGGWEDQPQQTQVLGLLNALGKEFSIDADRLYITGYSMGGFGTGGYASQHPDLFAAAVPICGAAFKKAARKLVRMPIWSFHAADDDVVSVNISRDMIDAVRKAGGNPIYTEYETGKHSIWETVYSTPMVLDWMYAQRRGVASTAPPQLIINPPTNRSTYVSADSALNLSGTASDVKGSPVSVTWTNYRNGRIAINGGMAIGGSNWAITNLPLSAGVTNLIVITGKSSSYNTRFRGFTTFNDTLSIYPIKNP